MTIGDLTLKEIKEISAFFNATQKPEAVHPFKIGKAYYIRTVTMHIIGKLEAVFPEELVVSQASWIADSGRFHDALKGGESKLKEVEPFMPNEEVIIGRGSIIDATVWVHEVPKNQK